jgi:hypothetical protein
MPQTKRYSLGAELLVLGAAALARFDPRPLVRPSLLRLTGTFEDSVDPVDPERHRIAVRGRGGGPFSDPRQLPVGRQPPTARRVGAGSLALLAWMPEAERQGSAGRDRCRSCKRYPRITPKLLETRALEARERGYAVLLDVVVERMGGIAVPILGCRRTAGGGDQHRGAQRPHHLARDRACQGLAQTRVRDLRSALERCRHQRSLGHAQCRPSRRGCTDACTPAPHSSRRRGQHRVRPARRAGRARPDGRMLRSGRSTGRSHGAPTSTACCAATRPRCRT